MGKAHKHMFSPLNKGHNTHKCKVLNKLWLYIQMLSGGSKYAFKKLIANSLRTQSPSALLVLSVNITECRYCKESRHKVKEETFKWKVDNLRTHSQWLQSMYYMSK